MQADILDLDSLEQHFDLVECVGVLHHMESPTTGWEILTGRLKPGGMMRLGFYSKIARSHIWKIRHAISYSTNDFDNRNMKYVREKIIREGRKEYRKILSSHDFYATSTLRDLLFHVQEQNLDISEIRASLKKFKLEFSGFEMEESIYNKFELMHGEANDRFDLNKWRSFESENPDTFSQMYQFWCQKTL